MLVEILETDKKTGVKKGQIYQAERYFLDPANKVVLVKRFTKKDRKPISKKPNCTEYLSNIKIIKN